MGTMKLAPAQRVALEHLRRAYIGPEGGSEEVLADMPSRRYAVAMLFPEGNRDDGERVEDDLIKSPGEATTEDQEFPTVGIPTPDEQKPSSVAISFVTDTPYITCEISGGTYAAVTTTDRLQWKRSPFTVAGIQLSTSSAVSLVDVNGLRVEIGSRWRPHGDAYLTTVHMRSLETSTASARDDIARTLFQVALAIEPAPGGEFLEYNPLSGFAPDDETAELRLRYRDHAIYAVGHGTAADWDVEDDAVCRRIRTEAVPAHVVPAVETTGLDETSAAGEALALAHLARIDENPGPVIRSLDAFVDSFEVWVDRQEERISEFGSASPVAERIVGRSRTCASRMRESVRLLGADENGTTRSAFSLGMKAMRLQMRQAYGGLGRPDEPRWRPFQLGFLLTALTSTADEEHLDRKVVDLIWFPTGGGKTEAYLGLAAVEIFRRRLKHGAEGGGTAVITRYTLRLLTAQQFQRAAALICAMELLRRPGEHQDARVKGMSPFSIGLWVGNDVTPATRKDAVLALESLRKATSPRAKNDFQLESCPWCHTYLLPEERRLASAEYGFRQTGADVQIHCPDEECPFHEELPVAVVDEVIYEERPTFLLGTVDKFARLQFKPEAGAVLGLGTPYRQPSLVIQDELHLLSGPLGTTVAVFDAVIQVLLSMGGPSPKIVASTATIRSSDEQVQGLYGRPVALYPPSGLDADRTFFSRPVPDGEGRLYLGLMPQAMSQASSLVATVSPQLELPHVIAAELGSAELDAYWTAVLYHNSLRELGRTGALVVDDVNARIEARADRLGLPARRVSAEQVLELTSRRGPGELPQDLRSLRCRAPEPGAVDVVLSSNMLSVGIDIPRLALMLMVGQPKTTSEYIQATSRVGRGEVAGMVITLFRPQRARDRSHFETFRGYHGALYRSVEPTSVTPWSLASRERSLAGALTMLLRHALPTFRANDAAVAMNLSDASLRQQVWDMCDRLLDVVTGSDPGEADDTRSAIRSLLDDWDHRAERARREGIGLVFDRTKSCSNSLLKRFGQSGEGWLVGDSMRSVEPNVTIRVQEP